MNIHITYPPILLDEPAAAAYLSISTAKLNQLQRQGRLIPKRLDGKRGFLRGDLDAFAEGLPDWERAS